MRSSQTSAYNMLQQRKVHLLMLSFALADADHRAQDLFTALSPLDFAERHPVAKTRPLLARNSLHHTKLVLSAFFSSVFISAATLTHSTTQR